jgi:hypothetical protein
MNAINLLLHNFLYKIVRMLITHNYLKERAERDSREKFDAALSQVAGVESVEGDEL